MSPLYLHIVYCWLPVLSTICTWHTHTTNARNNDSTDNANNHWFMGDVSFLYCTYCCLLRTRCIYICIYFYFIFLFLTTYIKKNGIIGVQRAKIHAVAFYLMCFGHVVVVQWDAERLNNIYFVYIGICKATGVHHDG